MSEAPHAAESTTGQTRYRVWYKADGVPLRCSPAAYEILRGLEEGLDDSALLLRVSPLIGKRLSLAQLLAAKRAILMQAEQSSLKKNVARQGILWHARIIDGHVAAALTAPLQKLFERCVVWPLFILATAACVFAGGTVIAHGLRHYIAKPSVLDVMGGYGVLLGVLALHEGGHAAALQRFGQRTNGMGVGLFLIFPFFFTDVTRAWTLPAKQRVVVDLAGLYLQCLATGPLFLAYALFPNGTLLTALSLLCGTFLLAANPFLRNDGYWALSDFLERPNLKRDAYRSLAHYLRGRVEKPGLALYAMLDVALLLLFVGASIDCAWNALLRTAETPTSPALYLVLAGSCGMILASLARLHVRFSLTKSRGNT